MWARSAATTTATLRLLLRGEWWGCSSVRCSHLFSISICSAAFTSQTALLAISPPCWQGWRAFHIAPLHAASSVLLHFSAPALWHFLDFGKHPPETLRAHPSCRHPTPTLPPPSPVIATSHWKPHCLFLFFCLLLGCLPALQGLYGGNIATKVQRVAAVEGLKGFRVFSSAIESCLCRWCHFFSQMIAVKQSVSVCLCLNLLSHSYSAHPYVCERLCVSVSLWIFCALSLHKMTSIKRDLSSRFCWQIFFLFSSPAFCLPVFVCSWQDSVSLWCLSINLSLLLHLRRCMWAVRVLQIILMSL